MFNIQFPTKPILRIFDIWKTNRMMLFCFVTYLSNDPRNCAICNDLATICETKFPIPQGPCSILQTSLSHP